jgi:hypothetical protein
MRGSYKMLVSIKEQRENIMKKVLLNNNLYYSKINNYVIIYNDGQYLIEVTNCNNMIDYIIVDSKDYKLIHIFTK